jgi:hypothetical protein
VGGRQESLYLLHDSEPVHRSRPTRPMGGQVLTLLVM